MKIISLRDDLKKEIKLAIINTCSRHGMDPSDVKYELKVTAVVNLTNKPEIIEQDKKDIKNG